MPRRPPSMMLAFTLLSAVFLGATPSPAAERASRPGLGDDPHGFRADLVRMARDGDASRDKIWDVLRKAVLELAEVDSLPQDPAGSGLLLPAGDLTGNGFDDAVENHWEEGISAVRGTNGSTLWTHEFAFQGPGNGDAFGSAIAAGDLSGDGRDDLIEVTVEETDLVAASPWQVTYRGIRGTNGATLWSRTYENPWAIGDAGDARAYLDVGFPIPLGISDDADGDGVEDLLHGSFHIANARAPSVDAWQEEALVELISGRTGSLISSFVLGPADGYTDAVPISDVTGDGLADVASASVSSEQGTAMVAARGGRTGSPVWQQLLSEHEVYLQSADLDGGGDILVDSVRYDGGDRATARTRLLSGTSGGERWRVVVPGHSAYSIPAGYATGDAVQEVMIISQSTDSAQQTFSAVATVVNGSSGSVIWSRTSNPDGFGFFAGDATGDGVVDVVFQSFPLDPGTNKFVAGPASLVSGADGTLAWSQADALAARIDPLGADLNGDGAADLVAFDKPWGPDGYSAINGRSGGPLWGSAASAPGVFSVLAANVHWTPGSELLDSGYDEQQDAEYGSARLGGSGFQQWLRQFGP